ncbi:MAG TPA: hypothetical protein VNK43_00115 [Gemmatimonadales bacterium]|nr:hypothetical protein [Gemmatimonadales bacterium]
MHTETNTPDAAGGPAWLWRQWHNGQLIRQAAVPGVGFTWFSLQDQVDWDKGLSRANGDVSPVGPFDLNRDPRPVAQANCQLLAMHRGERIPEGLPLSRAASARGRAATNGGQ